MNATQQQAIERYCAALDAANGNGYREKHRITVEYRRGFFYIRRGGLVSTHSAPWHGVKQLNQSSVALEARAAQMKGQEAVI